MLLGLIAGSRVRALAGPILSAVPGIILALAVSRPRAWVALLYFAVQQLEGYAITPLVSNMRSTCRAWCCSSPDRVGIIFGTLALVPPRRSPSSPMCW
jgi:hypothetical protein